MKKNFIVVKVWGLLELVVFFVMAFIVAVIWKVVQFDNFWKVLLICFGISIPISIIIFLVMMHKENKNPAYKLQGDLKRELKNNGYTDRILEIADQGIEACGDVPGNKNYLKDFALFAAECCIINHYTDRALEYMNKIDVFEIQRRDVAYLDYGMTVASFYGVQMELCMELHDPLRAKRVIEEGSTYLIDNYGKMPQIDVMIDDIYANYFYLIDDFDQAKERVQRILNSQVYQNSKMINGHLLMALIAHRTGDTELKNMMLNGAQRIMNETNRVISRQNYDYCIAQMQ